MDNNGCPKSPYLCVFQHFTLNLQTLNPNFAIFRQTIMIEDTIFRYMFICDTLHDFRYF